MSPMSAKALIDIKVTSQCEWLNSGRSSKPACRGVAWWLNVKVKWSEERQEWHRVQQFGRTSARCVVEVVLHRCFVCDALFWIGGVVGIDEGVTDGWKVVAGRWNGVGKTSDRVGRARRRQATASRTYQLPRGPP
eukprot:3115298-Amphidinium_carterae.1